MENVKNRFDEIYKKDMVAEEAKHVERSANSEAEIISGLMAERIRYKREMFRYPYNSEEYKAIKKNVHALKEKINHLLEVAINE